MGWCGKRLRLAKRMKDGSTLRDHLLAIPERVRNDEVRELLDEGPPPSRFFYLYEIFADLSRTRTIGLSSPNPIGFDQIYYWQKVAGQPLHKWEIDVILSIDDLWRDVATEQKKPEKPSSPKA